MSKIVRGYIENFFILILFVIYKTQWFSSSMLKYLHMSETNMKKVSTTKKKKKSHISYFLKARKGSDLVIHYCMLILAIFGTIMVASASMGLAVSDNSYLMKTVGKQAGFCLLGYIAMVYMSNRFHVNDLKSEGFTYIIIFMILALLLCLAFKGSSGVKAWIQLPIPFFEVTIQPSEFAKIVSILIVAAYCGDVTKHFDKSIDMLKRPIILLVIFCFIIWVLQSDFGSMFVLLLISCVCFLVPQHPQLKTFQKFLIGAFWFLVACVTILISPVGEGIINSLGFLKQYQKNRFLSAIDPFIDQYDTGYQLVNGLVSFASGGLFGVGFGNSLRKYTDFPAVNTDYILAIIVEELGYVGFLFLMILYCAIIFSLLKYARRMKNEKGRIILVGTAMYFVFHIFLNIGGVSGLIPLTGVPLLMMSAGGSSALSIMLCVGIAQAVISAYKQGEIQ